jgi:cytochrome oxidase Cu insertion factor (SCO1/SenC/PrrC family)
MGLADIASGAQPRPFRPRAAMLWLWSSFGLLFILALGAIMIPRSQPPAPALVGTDLQGRLAPSFRLRDQFGHTVALSHLRGRPVLLTTMQANCTQLCPVVAETVHRALLELGPDAHRVTVLALTTDPAGDTPAAVRAFSLKHGMWKRWLYLTGSRAVLTRIWASYFLYVAPAGAPRAQQNAHTSATFLIDARGRERILMTGAISADDLIRDVRILLGQSPGGVLSSVPAPEAGHPAPTFRASGLDGRAMTLDELRGKTVLLNFWATWCKPCRSEMPMLASWYRSMAGRGLVVVGIDEQEDAGRVSEYTHALGTPYTIVLDPAGDAAARYNVFGLPTSVLIDPSGEVRWVKPGVLKSTDLSRYVAPLLGGRNAR